MKWRNNMKKYIRVLLASSLLFSIVGSSIPVNEVVAKQSTKKTTVAEKKLFLNLKGGESKNKVKKIAKKNGWVESAENDSRYYLYYEKVNVYGYDSRVTFSFDEETNTLNYFQYNVSAVENFNKRISSTEGELKKYHNILYKKLKKDLGNKKGITTFNTTENYYFSTIWNINNTRIYLETDILGYTISRSFKDTY